MPTGLFRVRLSDGSVRLARGDAVQGPSELLAAGLTLDLLLGPEGPTVADALAQRPDGPVPAGARELAPGRCGRRG